MLSKKASGSLLDHSSASLVFPWSNHLVILKHRKNGWRIWHQLFLVHWCWQQSTELSRHSQPIC